MTPMRFSHGARELFGLHLEPRAATARGHAVLLCNPFGQEAIRAHRFYRVLGDRLAAAGFDVLRFDYYGSGDSGGEDADFDLDGSIADTVAAGRLLLQRSGAERLSCIGLRLGGNIALAATAGWATPAAHVAMLEPVPDGFAYLDELAGANAQALARTFGARWRVDSQLRAFNLPAPQAEALGFVLTPPCRAQIARIALMRSWPGRCDRLLILSRDVDVLARCAAARDPSRLPEAEVSASHCDIDWATNSALNTAIVPMHWVTRLLSELTEQVHA